MSALEPSISLCMDTGVVRCGRCGAVFSYVLSAKDVVYRCTDCNSPNIVPGSQLHREHSMTIQDVRPENSAQVLLRSAKAPPHMLTTADGNIPRQLVNCNDLGDM